MQALPVTYPHGPVALTHALIPGPYHPQPGPQPGPQPPCPCPCPWPSPHQSSPPSCDHGVRAVLGDSGSALATPAPSPRAVKPKALAIAAAAIIFFRFTVHLPVQITIGPSRKTYPYLALMSAQTKGTLGLRRV